MRATSHCFLFIVLVGLLLCISERGRAQTEISELLKDINPGSSESYPLSLITSGGDIYFIAYNPTYGEELWKSDGTPGGTALVKDIYPGASGSDPNNLVDVGGVLYFSADDGANGRELWKSDGTPGGTVMVKDINPGASSSNPYSLTEVGGVLYFGANDGSNGGELWKSDGTPGGTVMVKDIYPGASGAVSGYFAEVGGLFYFRADNGTNGYELWKSDGTGGGTVMVKDISPGPSGSSPTYLTDIGGMLYFSADDGSNGLELWKSDGTPGGTVMVKDINPGASSSVPDRFAEYGGLLYFQADDGTNGQELWKSDGTPGGTVMVKDISPGPSSSFASPSVDIGGILFLRASDPTAGQELWKSDGTSGGTVRVRDINPGVGGSGLEWLTAVGSVLYFLAHDGTNGEELWKSDGTNEGTVMVEDIYPGAEGSFPEFITYSGGMVFFSAYHPIHGNELWKSYSQDQVGKIQSISDIPDDQGGRVRLSWSKSRWDTTDASGHVTSYAVWRKIPAGLAPVNRDVRVFQDIQIDDTLLTEYDILMTVPAVRIPVYHAEVTTLGDSSGSGTPYSTYLITAHTTDRNYYYKSAPDSGYSLDNLSPIPPAGLVASIIAGPQVVLTWSPPTDPDVGYYTIYRSTTGGFTPTPSDSIGITTTTGYTDFDPVEGGPSYYRIIAVDVHDNVSGPSNEAEAAVTVNRQFAVQERWNIVSVPLGMSDYTKTVLFPSATTPAYAYDDGYFGYVTLENSRGYWMKFSSSGTISHDGVERTEDTIAVAEGWNMVGSLSSTIAVSSIGSIPGGIVTSPFYRYEAGYSPSSTIEPGRGYWVKVSEAGQLVMSTTSATPANRIRIEDTGEHPPPPPDEVSSAIPEAYALEQNYPNPFNPVTSISYALPNSEHVRLSVYNMVGQEVTVLVDGVEEAGYRTVSFDASSLPSGVYTYRITAGAFTDVKKMVLMK